jgi:hypothetical protein
MLNLLVHNLILATAIVSFVKADFHLMMQGDPKEHSPYFTCPSNYFSDKCWCNADRRSSVAYVEKQSNQEWKIRLEKICGVAELDFWWRPKGVDSDDRIQWEAYTPNADGHKLATCYKNGFTAIQPDCWIGFPIRYTVYEGWVCYSEICGHV